MIEGTRKSEDLVKLLTEKIKKIEGDTLPDSFVVDPEKMVEIEGIRANNRGRKRERTVAQIGGETKAIVRVIQEGGDEPIPLIIRVCF